MPPERGNCDTFNTARKNVLFDNFTLFAPLIKKIMPGIPQARAMLSASVSFTTIFAGSKDDPRIRTKEAEASLKFKMSRSASAFIRTSSKNMKECNL